jgi:formamidopyrimidine-DNA glycosylase
MPELPEVETVAIDLRKAGIIGQTIDGVCINWAKSIAVPAPKAFIERVVGQKIEAINRYGKFLIISLSGGDKLFIHLRMTGRLHLVSPTTPRAPHEHVILSLSSGRELRFHDTRKFGRWYLVSDPQAILGKLGLDPLENNFTVDELNARLHHHKRQLKPLLLDQSIIAGLGNIYVDEALWEAGLHPKRISSTFQSDEVKRLFAAIVFVLKRGLQASGTTLGKGLSNFYRLDGSKGTHQQTLSVFRRTGYPCPRCGELIIRLVVAERSTHICPGCQKI